MIYRCLLFWYKFSDNDMDKKMNKALNCEDNTYSFNIIRFLLLTLLFMNI